VLLIGNAALEDANPLLLILDSAVSVIVCLRSYHL
jgi:hypothetical protein